MASRSKPAPLFQRDDPVQVKDFMGGLWEESAPWRDRVDLYDKLLHNTHPITAPAGLDLPMPMTPVYSGIARQQHRMVTGQLLSSGMPQANLQIPSENRVEWAKTEDLEAASNSMWSLMERQSQEVWSPVTSAQTAYGLGWEAVEGTPSRISTKGGMPTRGKDQDADDYLKETDDYTKSMGTPGGRLFANWRHVPTQDVLWLDSSEGGLACVVEYREVRVMDIEQTALYKGGPTKFRNAVDDLRQKQYKGVSLCKVRLAHIETPWDITVWMSQSLSEVSDDPHTAGSQWALNQKLGTDGEVVTSFPNPLKGSIRYVPTHGLIDSSRSQWTRYRSIYHDQIVGIITLDTMMTLFLYDNQCLLFAPIIIEQDRPDPNAPAPYLSEGNTTTPVTSIDLTPAFHGKMLIPPGYKVRFLIRERSPEWVEGMDRVRRDIMLNGVPESVMDSGGVTSGYQMAQLLSVATAANNGLIKGAELACQQRTGRLHDWLRTYKHSPQVMQKTERGARWLKLDAELLQERSLYMTVDCEFRLTKVSDEAAALQNYLAATAPGPNQAMDIRSAREKYLSMTDHVEIEKNIRIDAIEKSPEVMKFYTDLYIAESGILEEMERSKERRRIALEELMQATPGAAQVAAEMAEQGQPGYDAAQQYLGMQNGQSGGATGLPSVGPPPEPMPPMSSQPNPTGAPRQGGRAAGQQVQPGGPRYGA